MATVSHPFVVERFVDPSIEAMSIIAAELRALYNPSPELDSVIEHLLAIEPSSDEEREHLQEIGRLVVHVAMLNGDEVDQLRVIAGAADTLACDLHAEERNGTSESLKAKAIAQRVRGPLDVLGEPADARAFVDAAWALRDLFDRVPEHRIFTEQVEHELGGRKFRRLRELWEQRMGARS